MTILDHGKFLLSKEIVLLRNLRVGHQRRIQTAGSVQLLYRMVTKTRERERESKVRPPLVYPYKTIIDSVLVMTR